MAVYEPNTREEDKWAHWESEDYIRRTYRYESKRVTNAMVQVQKLLKDNGYLGIPNCGGNTESWYYGLTVFQRAYEEEGSVFDLEYELSALWYDSGELFGERAEEYEHWELRGTGKDTEEAAVALVEAVKDFVDHGTLGAEIQAMEAIVEKQQRKIDRETTRLRRHQERLQELKDQRSARGA
jgi:hypothetical protein